MTTVMNQKSAKAFIKALEQKLMRKVKSINKKITSDDLIQFVFQLLPSKSNSQTDHPAVAEIISKNQQTIVDNLCQIQYLKRKALLQDQLTASFIKAILKEKNGTPFSSMSNIGLKKQNSILNLPTFSRCQYSRITRLESSRVNSQLDKSPIGHIENKQDQESQRKQRFGVCATSRSRISPCRGANSSFTLDVDLDQKQKIKALTKLRKLQRYVFEKQNVHKDKSKNKMWNCGISPTKKRYKQQNQNLKAIQTNLVTHLQILQKFREVPSIEGLIARQQALKKKERQLKDLGEILDRKQLQLNRKHSDFLKRQKSHKIL